MLDLFCVSHKELDLDGSGISLVGVGGASGDRFDYNDVDGESIAGLNWQFSELTGHYRIWKDPEIAMRNGKVGFCHYRRFLVPPSATNWIEKNCPRPFDNRDKGGEGNYSSGYRIEQEQLSALFRSCNYINDLESASSGVDIVLPKRNSLLAGGFRGQYQRCHPIEPFDFMIEAIKNRDPAMASAAREFFEQCDYAYWNNLLITTYKVFSEYCEFAFGVLLDVSSELSNLGGVYQNRACAFLSERLLNFWVFYNKLVVREVDWCVTSSIQLRAEPHQVAVNI